MLTYPEAAPLVGSLLKAISPRCMRAEPAGSYRRRKPLLKDIEIVAIAKREERANSNSLFSEPVDVDVLYEDWAVAGSNYDLPAGGTGSVQWIKTGTKNGDPLVPWSVKPFAFQWRGLLWLGEQPEPDSIDWNLREELLPPHVKLDLFLTTPEKWPVIFTIRTGSAEFSEELVTWAKFTRHTPVEKGRIMNYGKPVDLATERDVFDFLGLEWVEPEQRKGKEAIRPKR